MEATRRWLRSAGFLLALTLSLTAGLVASPAGAEKATNGPAPIVLFPAFHFTKLLFTVSNQTMAPACPTSGSFTDWFQNDHPSTVFSQECEDQLMTLRYNDDQDLPMSARFSNQLGVATSILDYGKTQSAPFYEAMYQALEAAGYVRNRDIRVAGYDARLTPDIGDFLARSKRLIEDTYRDNGHRPVHLVGHSNGPIYAEFLLTHTSRAWKEKYIHGFTPIAGNFPGQGSVWLALFSGLNIQDFSFPVTTAQAQSSARMYLTTPSTYISSADPQIFGDQETVVQDLSNGRSYTPKGYPRLLQDAGLEDFLPVARYYVGFLHMSSRSSFPGVDVSAEKGSGIPTVVGAPLPNLTVGQVLDPNTAFFTRDGDVNQEDITNDAVGAWKAMPCFRFSLTDNPGIDHFSLPSNPGLLARLIATAAGPRTECT
jgi:lecithin-cholesterol acyltransferase